MKKKNQQMVWIVGGVLGLAAVGGLVYFASKPRALPGGPQLPPPGVELWTPVAAPFTLTPGKSYRVSVPPALPTTSPEYAVLMALLPMLAQLSQAPADWPAEDKASPNAKYEATVPTNAVPFPVSALPPGVKVWIRS